MINPNQNEKEEPVQRMPGPSKWDDNGNPLKQCNWCKEMIHFDALVCPHCRNNPNANAKEITKQQGGIGTLILFFIILIIIVKSCQVLLAY